MISSFCFTSRVFGEERISVLSPGKKHFAGQTLFFHIQATGFYQIQEITVYYRYTGAKRFRKLSLKKESEVDFTGTIPGEKIIPPGIEYFIKLTDGRGQVFTLPPRDPEKNPFKLPVSLDTRPPTVEKIYPEEGDVIDETRPEIRAIFKDFETAVDPSSIRIFLDKKDVTPKSRVSENSVTYVPDSPLSYGPHTVTVLAADPFGNRSPPREWSFTVRQTARFDKADVTLELDGEGRLEVLEKDSSASPDWALQSRGKLTTDIRKGDFTFNFSGNVWYREEDGPGPSDDRFNLTDYLAEVRFGKAYLRLGDVSVNLTELSGASLSRRGAVMGIKTEDYEIQGFSTRSTYVTGFNGGIGAFNPDRRILGGKAKGTLIKPLDLALTLLYLAGKIETPGGYGVSTTEAPSEGDLFSILLEGKIRGEKLSFSSEYTASRFDEDLTSPDGKKTDSAWKVKVGSRGDGYNLTAFVKYLGPDFSTIVSPTSVNDRIEYTLGWGFGTSPLSFQFNISHYEDNVDRDPTLPVIRNKSGSVRVTFSSPGGFSVYSGYSITSQDSVREPSSYSPTKQVTHIINLGASFPGTNFSFFPIYTYTKVNDRSAATNNDSETHNLSVSASYRPSENVSLSPVFSYTNIRPRSTGLTTETLQSALSGTVSLMEGKLSLNTTLSWVDSKGSEGLSHTVVWSGIGQINFRAEDYLFGYGTQTLSLRGQFSRNEDKVAGTADEDYSVFLVVSFGIPVNVFGSPQGGGS